MAILSFGDGLNTAVFGAGGGIGAAFVDALAADPSVAQVHAVSRHAPAHQGTVIGHGYDPSDDTSIAKTVGSITAEGPLDLAIIAIGILHDETMMPEKTWRQIDVEAMRRLYDINTVLPTAIAKHVLPVLSKRGKSCLAALSARVGSIDDNRLGGWVSYRASKAALNMVIRTLSIELKRTNPNGLFIGLHPGTVDTTLSEPFQKNVPDGKLFTPAQSVSRLLDVIDGCSREDSGYVFAHDGNKI